MIIYEGKKPYKDKMFGSSDPLMFALGLVFLVGILVYWGVSCLWYSIRKK